MSDSKKQGRRALGRGLDALLATRLETGGLREIEIDRIEPNPNQPRQRFDRPALEELAASIRSHGLVQPVVVTGIGDDRFRLLVGERRWQAARLAGLERVPAVVREATDRQTLELALIENLQRQDLNPLEEAAAFQRLIQEFGLSQEELAQAVGRSRPAVANTLRLLALPEPLKRALTDERISEGHARALLGLTDRQAQLELLERVEREGLTVRQTEELVKRLQQPAVRPAAQQRDPNLEAVEEDLRRSLGTRVSIRHGRRGGRIIIEYYSDEEFQGLYDRLRS
jgi:ParB family chromosome partitioning protein